MIVIAIVLIPALSLGEWTSELLRPYADALQWLLVAGLLLLARDVIQRLDKSDSRLRALIQSLDELILILDSDGRYVEIPSTNRSLLYKPLEQLIGRRIHEVFPQDVADFFVTEIRRALASEQPTSVDYALPIDGKTVWFNAAVTRLSETTVIWVARDITQRKAAEFELENRVAERTRELRESEERYRSVFDQADEVIYTLSRDGVITSLNPAFERALGWPVSEWIGKPFMSLVPADMHSEASHLFAELLREGHINPSRFVVLAKNGSRRSFELSIVKQVLRGERVGFLGVARDVTERDLAEAKLRNNERLLAEAQAVAKVGSFEHDLTTDTLWWSEELYRMFGMRPSAEPIPTDVFNEMVVPDDRPKIEEVQRAMVARGDHEWEMRLRAADGTVKTTKCRGKLISDPSKGSIRIIGAVRDITEEKRADDLLKKSEERFRLAMQAASEAMWDIDLATGKSWHSEGYRTFGYEEGMVENGFGWWKERLHPEDADRVISVRDEAWHSGQPSWSAEYRLRKADGGYAHVLHRALILRDAEKRPIRVVGALLDMTERRQLLDQLEQARRVSSLGRVAASIAHEFNNVLMGIQPNVEAIQRSSPSGLKVMTENINRAVLRGKRVTDEILRFTRPSEPALECVDVSTFFAKWRDEVDPLLGVGVETIVDLPAEAIHVSADPIQLAQIFTNLALNARDAMQDSGGSLTISAHLSNSFGTFPFGVVKTPDRFVHFTVQDEGCGISSDRLSHIFEPLFTTKRGGIGLGLAITYQIVTRHGGHIFVESEVGHGSAFHIFLPAALPQLAAPAARDHSKFASIQKLLLVEDEPAVASGIAMLLEMERIQVRTVYTGRESIPAIEEFRPDAVILDIGLPDMDGVGVYLEIQRRWPDLAVLFSSGHGDSAKLEAHLARPNVGFILKPYEFDALRAALCRLVEERPAEQAC